MYATNLEKLFGFVLYTNNNIFCLTKAKTTIPTYILELELMLDALTKIFILFSCNDQ